MSRVRVRCAAQRRGLPAHPTLAYARAHPAHPSRLRAQLVMHESRSASVEKTYRTDLGVVNELSSSPARRRCRSPPPQRPGLRSKWLEAKSTAARGTKPRPFRGLTDVGKPHCPPPPCEANGKLTQSSRLLLPWCRTRARPRRRAADRASVRRKQAVRPCPQQKRAPPPARPRSPPRPGPQRETLKACRSCCCGRPCYEARAAPLRRT